MLEFYYIRGINRFDTPKFEHKEHQEAFFRDYYVSNIDNGYFYPPYYQNTINVSDDDLNFKSNINYLSIQYNGKKYYYFIDRVSYVTDGIMTLHITMDTIQTFMFDIDFLSSQVNRRSIKRWDNGSINRDYIRENLSEGQFLNKTLINYNENECKLIVIKTTKNYENPTNYNNEYIRNYSDGTNLLILPFPYANDEYYDKILLNFIDVQDPQSTQTVEYSLETIYKSIHHFASQPEVFKMYLVDARFLGIGAGVRQGLNALVFNFTGTNIEPYQDTNGILSIHITDITVVTVDIGEVYTFDFNENNVKTNSFNYKFCPQLLDTNYIQLYFGEKKEYTSYPLEKSTGIDFALNLNIDVFSNTRFYDIKGPNEYYDTYNTSIVVTTNRDLTLINDPWKEFLATNHGMDRLYQAQIDRANAQTLQSTLFTGFYSGPTKTASQGISGFKQGGKIGAAIGIISGVADTVASIGKDVISNEITKDYITEKYTATRENYQYSPNIIKKANSGVDFLFNDEKYIICAVDQVTDIVDVAQKYEGYGYAVHENYGKTNLFEIGERYYFNIIKCDKLEIVLKNVISDNETLLNIKERFYNGLRLWNVYQEDQIAYFEECNPYKYDNVEIDNLE